MPTTNDEVVAAIQGMSARFDLLESTAVGQGRQLNELAGALRNLQNMQTQSNEWQAKVAAHME